MNWKAIVVATLALLVLQTSSSWAQYRQPPSRFGTMPDYKLEIIPLGGYVWTVSRSFTYQTRGGEVDIKSSGFYGLAVDVNVRPGGQLRLLYRRQDSKLTFKDRSTKEDVTDMSVEYWHIGGVGYMPRGDKLRGFSSVTLGGTHYIFDNFDNDWRFSIIIGLGAKIDINERIGIMLQGSMPFTIFTGGASIGIGTGGAGVYLGGSGIAQFDLGGGLIVKL